MLEIGSKVAFTYLTGTILLGEVVGRTYIIAEKYNAINGLEIFREVESYQIGVRDIEGILMDTRWLSPSCVKAI